MNDREILSNPVFISEKYEHDRFCNGDGEIVSINRFTSQVTYRECKFCSRLERYRQKQTIKRLEQDDGYEDLTRDG